ncbi:MAG: LysE family transporter [Anaerolineales bacterium]
MRLILRNVLLGISVAAPIGPAGLAVIQAGLRTTFRRAFVTALGVTLADTCYLLLAFFGLAGFVETPSVQVVLWLAGGAALIYLGWKSLLEAIGGIELAVDEQVIEHNPLLVGFAVNIANPLAIVWWMGVFGSLMAEGAQGSSQLVRLGLSATILIGILAWHTLVGALSRGGGRALNQRLLRWVTGAAGSALILFGLRFVLLSVQAIARVVVD